MNVPTLDYIDLYNATALAARLQLDDSGVNLTTNVEFVALRTLHSDRLRMVWEANLWPFLRTVDKRYFRLPWNSGTTYAAPTLTAAQEVYYPGPQKYYQSLRASTNQAPATLSGTTWTTNLAYWAECQTSYTANPYSASTAYVQGDQAYDPVTDRVYQLYAASSTGNAVTDATKWGMLTPFDRYIAFSQTGQNEFEHAFGAWDQHPRLTKAASRLDSYLSDNGVQVLDTVSFCFLDYRLICPALTGDVLETSVAYAAGDQVYYSSATSRGNFWDVLSTTVAGDTPESNAAAFQKVEIPKTFQKYLTHGAAGDYLDAGEAAERAARELLLAENELARLNSLHFGQLGYHETRVLTR